MAENILKRLVLKVYHKLFPISNEELLRKRGCTIGHNVAIVGDVNKIDMGHAFLLTIGDDVTITNARILTHDASTKRELGYSRVGRVTIGSHVFIGADAIILPGVTIGDHVIIGAGCVVSRDVEADSVMVGNPARKVGTYQAFLEKNRQMLAQGPVFDTCWEEKTDEQRLQEKEALTKTRIGFDA